MRNGFSKLRKKGAGPFFLQPLLTDHTLRATIFFLIQEGITGLHDDSMFWHAKWKCYPLLYCTVLLTETTYPRGQNEFLTANLEITSVKDENIYSGITIIR
ncbi:hypothetical protein AWENTII_004594 [Aspergillus wentii]